MFVKPNSIELHAAATRTVADAGALGFLARLDARLLEIAVVAELLDETLLVEDLLQTLQPALDGLALLELENNSHYFTSFAGSFFSSAAGAATSAAHTYWRMHISVASPLRVPSLMMRV